MNTNTIYMNLQEKIDTAVSVLQEGGLILYPTDTIWGLGCDALNENAVDRVYQIKQRDKSKSPILLVSSVKQLTEYVEDVHPKLNNLIEFSIRPVTIVFENPKNLPSWVQASDGSVALRVTSDPYCQALIKALNKPLLSTSANISGEPFPTSFEDISEKLLGKVEHVALHRRDEVSKTQPSVIVKLSEKDELIFLRN